jgi:hypothetical protein
MAHTHQSSISVYQVHVHYKIDNISTLYNSSNKVSSSKEGEHITSNSWVTSW